MKKTSKAKSISANADGLCDAAAHPVYCIVLHTMTQLDIEWQQQHLTVTREIQHILTTACLHINCKAHVACDLDFVVKGEGLLSSEGFTGSHVQWKSDNIS